MAPSTWKVQPRKRENHCSVPAASQNSQQQNVDFVVFVAALLHPCIPASMHRSIHPCILNASKSVPLSFTKWLPQHGKCSHENERTIVLSLQPPRIHNNKMLILSFSWLHFSCGRHFLGHCMHLHASTHPWIPASMHRSIHPSMHVCIKICSIVLRQMAPSTWPGGMREAIK